MAADGEVAADDTELASEPASADTTGTDPLVWVALALGALGLLTGALGLRAARTARG